MKMKSNSKTMKKEYMYLCSTVRNFKERIAEHKRHIFKKGKTSLAKCYIKILIELNLDSTNFRMMHNRANKITRSKDANR